MKELDDYEIEEDQINEVYHWIDQVELTRPKKNIGRDFCDGVMMAEVV